MTGQFDDAEEGQGASGSISELPFLARLGAVQSFFRPDHVWEATYFFDSAGENKKQLWPRMNQSRFKHAAVSLENPDRIVVVGGAEKLDPKARSLDSVEVYYVQDNRWDEMPSLKERRSRHSLSHVDGKVYAFGGRNSASIEVLHLADAQSGWKLLEETLSCQRRGSVSVAVGTEIFVIGGWDGEKRLASIDIFDTVTNGVRQGPQMTSARYGCAAGAVGNRIFAAGGGDNEYNILDTIEELVLPSNKNSETFEWRLLDTKLSKPRLNPSSSVMNGCIVIAGGYNQYEKDLPSAEVFDPERGACWRLPNMSIPRGCPDAVTIGSYLYVIGGKIDMSVLNSMERLSLEKIGKEEQKCLLNEMIGYESAAKNTSHLPVFLNSNVLLRATEKLFDSGQATIYRGKIADREAQNEDIAIKVFHKKDKHAWSTCRRELEHFIKLPRHENVMQVLHAFKFPEPCFAMRYFKDGDLRDYLTRNGKPSPDITDCLLHGIGKGLQHLHFHKLVHRDLKPENVLLEQNGLILHPVLIDLGLGKCLNQEQSYFTTYNEVGTLRYMPPESAEGCRLVWSCASDMYALGIIMWELLTGKVPYSDKNLFQLVKHVAGGGRPAILEMEQANVSNKRKQLVKDLWRQDRTKRPSAKEFLGRLDDCRVMEQQQKKVNEDTNDTEKVPSKKLRSDYENSWVGVYTHDLDHTRLTAEQQQNEGSSAILNKNIDNEHESQKMPENGWVGGYIHSQDAL